MSHSLLAVSSLLPWGATKAGAQSLEPTNEEDECYINADDGVSHGCGWLI